MKIKKSNNEVYFSERNISNINREDIISLKKMAMLNQNERIRLCMHRDVNNSFHEMFIVHAKNYYVRPHKHLFKSESFHIVEGRVDLVVFNESGDIVEAVKMGDYSSELSFYYRISEPLFHTLIIKSRFLIFHESTTGPFNRAETVFAPWSPDSNEKKAVKLFQRNLKVSLENFKVIRNHGDR